MSDQEAENPEKQIGFLGGWRGLYIFILFYCVVQIILLYIFTVALNRN